MRLPEPTPTRDQLIKLFQRTNKVLREASFNEYTTDGYLSMQGLKNDLETIQRKLTNVLTSDEIERDRWARR